MASIEREEQTIFEDEVRRVARELWPEAQHDGARILDGRERDGVFETEECVHLLETTVSRTKDKAKQDINKLTSLARTLPTRSRHKAVKCWFVTKHEPTAEQREVAKRHKGLVNALSFSQFQSKLIDAATYLSLRENYPFGSVRDPASGSPNASIEYIPLDLKKINRDEIWSVTQICDALLKNDGVVLLGDYGSGKSMTLREIYRTIRRKYLNKSTSKFPIYLNLRDHFGQVNSAEILERHARNLGFPNPPHLVRAWRAGYAILIIDGFDELTTLGIQGLWKQLKDSRYRAMQAVREFVASQQNKAGIILAGRAHFFDSEKERRSALKLSSDFVELTLNEFSTEQVQSYLSKSGLAGMVPGWMPSRPLLVGYLAASGLLKEFVVSDMQDTSTIGDPAKGWDLILEKVCAREAEIEAGIDGPTVRKILERLATYARNHEDGIGPLTPDQLISAFTEVCGYRPDEKGMVLLQRLPGLGIERADEGTRIFIDEYFADACKAGDVIAFINDPYATGVQIFKGIACGIGQLGLGVAVAEVSDCKLTGGKLNAALRRADEIEDLTFLRLDVTRVIIEAGCSLEISLMFKDIFIPTFELYAGAKNCSGLHFRDCYFSKIEFDPELDPKCLPKFYGCYVDEVDGRASRKDLPPEIFDNECVFEKFSEAPETTSAISAMDLPLGAKVLLTVLKKIYVQSGAGRKENALHRGLDHHGRRLVGPVLRLLQSEGLASPYRRGGLDMTIWVPDRTKASRVARIITSPRTCGDPLLDKASNL